MVDILECATKECLYHNDGGTYSRCCKSISIVDCIDYTTKKDLNKVVLDPERSLDADKLCDQLREKARQLGLEDGTVDCIEWKAASVIRQLLLEREDYEAKVVRIEDIYERRIKGLKENIKNLHQDIHAPGCSMPLDQKCDESCKFWNPCGPSAILECNCAENAFINDSLINPPALWICPEHGYKRR